jgi:hypothetical protein
MLAVTVKVADQVVAVVVEIHIPVLLILPELEYNQQD